MTFAIAYDDGIVKQSRRRNFEDGAKPLRDIVVEPNCPRPSGGVKVEYLEVDVNTWSDLPPQPNPYTL